MPLLSYLKLHVETYNRYNMIIIYDNVGRGSVDDMWPLIFHL